MTRPLRQFADAAERIGLDVRSPPLPERGSRELRNATRAFNRMQERLRRFVDDRTMMLAAISHDLRTMLTRLKLRAELIEDAEQQRKAIADLDEMQDMLDSTFAFVRDGAAEESRTQTDLAALVQSLCDDMVDARQPVTCTTGGRLPYVCAPGSIKRAVQNIIVNAVKYGDAADVMVRDGADQIDISVTDKGPGIPADRREDVFRPFSGSKRRATVKPVAPGWGWRWRGPLPRAMAATSPSKTRKTAGLPSDCPYHIPPCPSRMGVPLAQNSHRR